MHAASSIARCVADVTYDGCLSTHLRSFAFDRGGLLCVVVLGVYCWLTPGYIVDGDNAEFSTLGALGGAAHPPGYPLYVLYLQLMSWLPASSAARDAALATAVLGAASLLVLHASCRAWGARPASASIAVAVFAGAPVVLRLHTAAEVFALNNLLVALVLWLAASTGPVQGTARTVALGLVAGLALTNHHMCVLVSPVGLLGAIRGVRESRRSFVAAAVGFAAMLLGLSPYLYLAAGGATAASWGHANSFSDLLSYFTRADYGGIGAFSPVPGAVDVSENLVALARTVGRAWLWVLVPVGLLLLGRRIVGGGSETRWGWRMLALSLLLAGPLLAARFNVVPQGLGLYIVERFHMLAALILVIPVAVALDLVADRLPARVTASALARPRILQGLAIGVFVAAAGMSLPHLLATHSPAVEKGIANTLRSLPENAVVICSADDLYFGSLYVQTQHGIRPDVDVVSWMMTTLPWYRERLLAREVLLDLEEPADVALSVRVARQVLRRGRPLFVDMAQAAILTRFHTYPYGALFRVLPDGAKLPTLDEIIAINRRVFDAFDLDYPRPAPDAEYAAETHRRYSLTWAILANELRKQGRRDEANELYRVARDLMPAAE